MPDRQFLSLAKDLRAQSEEVMVRAETFHDADVRQKLRSIAASYVKPAQRLE